MRILYLSETDLVRGPMALHLSRSHALRMEVEGVEFSSAGISASSGARPDPEFLSYMRGHHFDVRAHRATPLSHRMACEADVILAMTHDIGRRAQATLGKPHEAKVRVLNHLIGFGDTEEETDLPAPAKMTHGSLLTVYSRLKASTGRFVRNISHGCDTPGHFGIPEITGDPGSARDQNPEARRFLSLRILDLLRRAYEPMTTEMIVEALVSLGADASPMLVAEVLERELDGRVTRTAKGGWEAAPADNNDAASDNGATPPPHRTEVRFTVEEAFAFLAISRTSSIEEAKRNFRKLVSRYHPDKFFDDPEFHALAEIKARRMNKAWEVVEKALKGK